MSTHHDLPHIHSVIYSTPWAILPPWIDDIAAIFERHIAGEKPMEFTPKVRRGRRCVSCKKGVLKAIMVTGSFGPVASGNYTCPECGCNCSEDILPPYELINGVAILELTGPLFPKANMMTRYSGATSYDEFSSELSQSMLDPDVNGVVILSDSPGGSVLGMAECCSRIYAARQLGSKPIIGLIDPMAASAAYALISQCDQVFIGESGIAGSIGIVMKSVSWDRAIENEGGRITKLASSDLKSFDAPQTLSQLESSKKLLTSYFEQFKEIVVRGRPKIDIEKVSNAEIWIGKDAVRMGLVDGVSTLEMIIEEMTVSVA